MDFLTEIEAVKIAKDSLGFEFISKGKTKGGISSCVFELESSDGRKYYFKQGNSNYLLQKKLSEMLLSRGISVPVVELATDKYMILRSVKGEPVKEIIDRKKRLEIVRKFGEYLANLHTNMVSGWGELVDLDKAKYSSYLEYYGYLLQDVDEDVLPAVKYVLENTSLSCLNHADTGSSHIYTDREENFWGLIDFDDVLGAPNLYDLAEFHGSLDGDEEMWNNFEEGYSKVGGQIDITSLEFLVNEYLIFLDSVAWYKKGGRSDLEVNMQRDMVRVENLVSIIKKLQ